MRLSWEKLLSEHRLASSLPSSPAAESPIGKPAFMVETRTEAERDHDRLRFSAPVRRLSDKTQVFPLERNDSVRTRLTHSEEVSAVARSIGVHLAYNGPPDLLGVTDVARRLPAILAAAGLAHDLGNPPFGHQGEQSMRAWFRARPHLFGEGAGPCGETLTEHCGREEAVRDFTASMRADFRIFEGNAQMLRLVTRLQSSTNGFGLNLTCATLATLMKYVVPSAMTDPDGPQGSRKVGYFQSEATTVGRILESTGLEAGVRHPLAYILEACDDLCYCVVDAEDAVKKGLVSFQDSIGHLNAWEEKDDALRYVAAKSEEDHREARQTRLPPAELNDVSMQRLRVHAIGALVGATLEAFTSRYTDIIAGTPGAPLLDGSGANQLVRALKAFDKVHAYRNRDVLAVEAVGHNTIHGLMSMLWCGISEREAFGDPSSRRTSPFADLAYSHVSDNYRRTFEKEAPCSRNPRLPMRYRELQLLADNVAGMTDTFAVSLHDKLSAYQAGASRRAV